MTQEPVVAITHRIEFSASHVLRNPAFSDAENERVFGICANLHGHNYAVEVTVLGPVPDDTGMVLDLKVLGDLMNERIFRFVDHKDLNTQVPFLAGTIPTAEVLAVRFWGQLEPELRAFERCRLHRIRVYESRNNLVDYWGPRTSAPDPSAI